MTSTPLRLGGVPEHFNLPWHLTMESQAEVGSLTDLDLSWENQPGGTGQMLTKLADGQLDIVSILTEGTVKAIADGLPVTMIQVYVDSPLQWGVFVPRQSEFDDLSKLAGARIAISRFGSGSHLMAYVLARRLGWSINKNQFAVVNNLDGAIEAFADGTADLFLWDQFMTRSLVTSGAFRQIGVQPTAWPSFVIAARNEIVSGRTTDLGRVVDAVIAAATAMMNRPDGADLVADRYGLSIDTAKEWFETTSFASRRPMEPDIATGVLATLRQAGLR